MSASLSEIAGFYQVSSPVDDRVEKMFAGSVGTILRQVGTGAKESAKKYGSKAKSAMGSRTIGPMNAAAGVGSKIPQPVKNFVKKPSTKIGAGVGATGVAGYAAGNSRGKKKGLNGAVAKAVDEASVEVTQRRGRRWSDHVAPGLSSAGGLAGVAAGARTYARARGFDDAAYASNKTTQKMRDDYAKVPRRKAKWRAHYRSMIDAQEGVTRDWAKKASQARFRGGAGMALGAVGAGIGAAGHVRAERRARSTAPSR